MKWFHRHKWKYAHGKQGLATGSIGESCSCGLHRHLNYWFGEPFAADYVSDCPFKDPL